MLVLDIDLDFFLSEVTWDAGDDKVNSRFPGHLATPWPYTHVKTFLEEKCGLSIDTPVKGKVVEHHHEVFSEWRRLISSGHLPIPFTVVHVDAHADLGGGIFDTSPRYIVGDLLHKAPSDRTQPAVGGNSGLQPCNFLAFAVVCEWVNGLTFVLHRQWKDDLPRYCLRGNVPQGRVPNQTADYLLQFSAVNPSVLDKSSFGSFIGSTGQPGPQSTLSLVRCDEFDNSAAVDFMFLSKSPDYTPESADGLIPIIRQYMRILDP